jgi:hypothetical protein
MPRGRRLARRKATVEGAPSSGQWLLERLPAVFRLRSAGQSVQRRNVSEIPAGVVRSSIGAGDDRRSRHPPVCTRNGIRSGKPGRNRAVAMLGSVVLRCRFKSFSGLSSVTRRFAALEPSSADTGGAGLWSLCCGNVRLDDSVLGCDFPPCHELLQGRNGADRSRTSRSIETT